MSNKHIKSNYKNSLDVKVVFPIQCLSCHLTLQVSSQTNCFTVELRRCKCLRIILWTVSFACLWKAPLTTLSSASGQQTGKTTLFFQKAQLGGWTRNAALCHQTFLPFFPSFLERGVDKLSLLHFVEQRVVIIFSYFATLLLPRSLQSLFLCLP